MFNEYGNPAGEFREFVDKLEKFVEDGLQELLKERDVSFVEIRAMRSCCNDALDMTFAFEILRQQHQKEMA